MDADVYAPNVPFVAGITGRMHGNKDKYSVVTNCVNNGKVTGLEYVGGIVALGLYQDSELKTANITAVSDCINTGEIVATARGYAGGIMGSTYLEPEDALSDPDLVKITVKNCKNQGNVLCPEGVAYAGGIIGGGGVVKGTLIIEGCTNSGVVKIGNTTATDPMGSDMNRYLGLIAGGNTYP